MSNDQNNVFKTYMPSVRRPVKKNPAMIPSDPVTGIHRTQIAEHLGEPPLKITRQRSAFVPRRPKPTAFYGG